MKRTITLMLAASAFTLSGCDQVKKIEEDNETGGGGVPTAVQERLTASCALVGCHVAGSTAPDLSEAGGGAWVEASGSGGPYVTFGDVDNSYLVEKMLPNPSAGSQMPIGAGVLAPEDLAVIVGWVAGVDLPTETGPATTGGSGETGAETTAGETSESGSGPVLCSLSAVDPDAESPVVSGDGAGVIPSAIGTALEENCGCHYTDSVSDPMLYFPYSGGTQLQTLANFTDDYAGANSNYAGMAAWMAVQDRVITQATMPTAVCETEEGGIMSAADFALFEAWFEQGAPDGASFTPPG